ncbi:class I lanthipeptide [Taibaiella helva]|uniref:class I lanthipeptide n=1 Tax=Taibaiella helva TaxID=2301235 RepID=UPI000E58694C|nr:class I lanthipeptide [Taibaiella helva]
MKKKNLSAKLHLKKKIITSLVADSAGNIKGGSATCESIAVGCATTSPTFQPQCTLGICFIKNTDGCPTTSNMCPTSPEVHCTIAEF